MLINGRATGYLAIYLIGLDTGIYILPPDPSFYARLHQRILPPSYISPSYLSPSTANSNPSSISTKQGDDGPDKRRVADEKAQAAWKEKPGKLASVLGSWAILWCTGYWGLTLFGGEVSRRLVRHSPRTNGWGDADGALTGESELCDLGRSV